MAIDGGSVEIRFEGDVTPLRRSVEEAVESLEDVKQAANTTDKSLSSSFEGFGKKAQAEFEEFANNATDAFARVIDSSDSFIANINQIGSALKNIGFGVLTAGATAATKSLVKMAKGAISDTSALEKVQIQMIGLTDSVEKGNKAMAMAVQYFKNNPFNRFEVTNATKSLIQFGAELDQIPTLLDKMGKVALSTGQSIETIAYYYQRNISDGRVATRDLLQMQNQGIPIFGALAKQIGVTSGAIRELAAKGKISIEDFQKAFDSLVSDEAMERFNETLSRQLDRFRGRISNMRAALAGYSTSMEEGLLIDEQGLYRSWTRLVRTFADIMDSETGQRIYDGFTKIGQAISKIIDQITKLLEPAMNIASRALNFLGDNSELLIPLLGGLAVALGRFGSNLPVVGDLIKGITNNFSKLYGGLKNIITLHPGLSALVALLGVGFMEAYKNDEEFRKTIIELGQALKEVFDNLMKAVRGVLPIFVNLIKELANSGVIKGILQAVAGSLKIIAQVIASIPSEALAGLMSFILSLKLLNANPIMFAVTAITLLIQYIKELGGISKFFANLPDTLRTIGHNIMTGLFNGIKEGASKVINFVKQVASSIVSTFKNMLGIHSPSTVMYGVGQNIGLGLANGIEDSSNVVQVAMNNLAEDILKLSEKVISNKVDFNLLDVKGEYQAWKKVSQLFTQGSEQYNYAIEKMEDARKKANLQILNLQKTYNNSLDSTIKKISSMYGLFDSVNLGGGKNSSTILRNLDQQVAKLQEWATAQEVINSLGLDPALVEELKNMGVSSVAELSAIANMTANELSTLNELWLKKQSIANDAGIKQMEGFKNDTLKEINDLKSGIDGVTVDIADVGGRLVESISEGVYGAMPTLESAFSQLQDYIEKARKQLTSGVGGVDTLNGVDDNISVPDTGVVLKEEIEASMEKLKSMLPNILLGAIGAWGAFKFGPKILNAIGNKLFSKGGNIAEGLSGTLFKLAKGGKLGKVDLEGIVDILFANSVEGSNSQKIISAIQDKIKGIGSTNTIAENAKRVAKSTKATEVIAQSSTQISKDVQVTGQSMSKANSWMGAIQQGAKTVIYIAGAIAAVAGALWVTYNALKDVDFKKLTEELAMMTIAVGAFGALAWAADKLQVGWKGVLAIIGIAVDIAAVAVACRTAYEAMKDIPWDGFASALGMMASAVAAFGVLNGILGIKIIAIAEGLGLLVSAGIVVEIIALSKSIREAYDTMKNIPWDGFGNMLGQMAGTLVVMGALNAPLGALMPLAALGWVSITLICDEMIKLSKALVEVDKNVPADFDSLESKLKHIKKTLEIINGLDLGTVIGMMVTSWSAGPVERIMKMYLEVAQTLNKLSEISLDQEKIETNLDYIKSVCEAVKSKSDVISGFLQQWADSNEASSVESAGRIVITYGNVVDSLNKLATFKADREGINRGLVSVASVISLIRQSTEGKGGIFNIFSSIDSFANEVEKIKSILDNYKEMIPTIQSVGEDENQISDKLTTKVTTNVDNIKEIVKAIGTVDTGGYIDVKENDIKKIQSMLNNYKEMIPTIQDIAKMDVSNFGGFKFGEGYTGARKVIEAIKEIVLAIGQVDTGGWIEQKENDVRLIQSILNKFTELAQTTHHFGRDENQVAEGALEWIQTVRHMVWEIGQINTSGSKDVATVDTAIQIANKFKEFQLSLKELDGTDYTSLVNNLVTSINTLLGGMSTSFESKLTDFQNLGVQISQKLGEGINSQAEALVQAGVSMQSSIWAGVDSKIEDEYYQGRSLGERLRQGFYDIDYGNAGWWAVQGFINGAWGKAGSSDGVYNTGWWIADRFLKGLKDRGGQGSPWKTTFQSGVWAGQGLVDGLRSSESAVINEATSLADRVIDALSIENVEMLPSLGTSGYQLAPSVIDETYVGSGVNGSGVIINQDITNYTPYDIERINSDLSWMLSKV